MNKGDVQTITLKMAPNKTFPKTIERDWLRYLGYDEKDILGKGEDIELLLMAGEERVGQKVQPIIKLTKAPKK